MVEAMSFDCFIIWWTELKGQVALHDHKRTKLIVGIWPHDAGS